MDTGEGRFKQFNNTIENNELEKLKKRYPKHGGVFTVGEEVELKGSRFRVRSVKGDQLRLKLLKKA